MQNSPRCPCRQIEFYHSLNIYTLPFSLYQNKFTALALAFKTDKLTLTNRLELQQRQRDTAEKNIEDEIAQLKTTIGNLNRMSNLDGETREVLQGLQQQVTSNVVLVM